MHKDNIIKYQSNRYSIPLYTPHGDNIVHLRVEEEELIIEKAPGGESLAVHLLSKGKGQLIKNTRHFRDRTKGIQERWFNIKKWRKI